jgi:hypothetical protein
LITAIAAIQPVITVRANQGVVIQTTINRVVARSTVEDVEA